MLVIVTENCALDCSSTLVLRYFNLHNFVFNYQCCMDMQNVSQLQ